MPSVLHEVRNGVAILTLNRPEKINAFNREMSLSLQEKLDDCAKDRSVRAVMITGASKGFSAGQDLAEASAGNGRGLEKILPEQLNPIVLKINNLQKPVVAAVNGVAAGAAANIALNCDITIAAASAYFTQAFSKIGLMPDSGGTFILPRLIGMQKAAALMMLGEKVFAEEAAQMGMIYKVFPDESFNEEAFKMAAVLAQMPTRALALTKQALARSLNNDLGQQLKVEEELQRHAAASSDFREGVGAFMEKRNPVFTGE